MKTVGFNNERLMDNAYYALLVILKILGENIQKVSAFTRADDSKVLYQNTHVQYEGGIGHVKAGTGVKSESSWVISGTKGYSMYLPRGGSPTTLRSVTKTLKTTRNYTSHLTLRVCDTRFNASLTTSV